MITQDFLKAYLRYEPDTGRFFKFKDDGGEIEVGHRQHRDGYIFVSIDGKKHQAHRLAWLYVYGSLPDSDIDHRDRNKANNIISNLREANDSQNSMNRGIQSNNTSGFPGVTWNKSAGKWQAQAKLNRKVHYLGLFKEVLDAAAAYEQFRDKWHGEFHGSRSVEVARNAAEGSV